jgi:hypothetical protein
LIRAPLSTTSVLDETTEVVSLAAAPWAAVLVLASLPYRLLQVMFLGRLIELGDQASHYGRALGELARWTTAAFVLALLGRAVWARACRLADATAASEGEKANLRAAPLRVPIVALASYIFTAAFAELIFFVSLVTFAGIPVAIMFAGLAIGTMELNQQVGIRAPLRLIAKYAKNARLLLALTLIFALAILLAWLNFYAVTELLLWLAGAFGFVDIARWSLLLSMRNPQFNLLLLAAAILVIEPFWIAANVVLVRKAGALESGDELRLWFRELQA